MDTFKGDAKTIRNDLMPSRKNVSLWDRAKERYLMEVQEHSDFDAALETATWEMILVQTKAQEPLIARNPNLLTSIKRLEPTLIHLNDFATVIAVLCGADAKTAALVWGSIRLIISLASPVADMLNKVLSMLEELSLSLPRFKAYEDALPLNEGLENALVDVYVEIISFCARTVRFFRSNPQQMMLRNAWPSLDRDYQRTIGRLKALSRVVEEEAEAAKMRLQFEKNSEILSLLQSLKTANLDEKPCVLPCFYVPFTLNERFVERSDIVERVGAVLNPTDAAEDLKSLAIYGTGGVGKTQIALQYAHKARTKFDAILWISADNNIKMGQDFAGVAQRLGLVEATSDPNDLAGAMAKTKNWLADTECKWLLIFDNADNLEVLKYGWPRGCNGSILITTRDFTAGFSPAARGIAIEPFDENSGASALLSLIGRGSEDGHDVQVALEISRALGGLPLALGQISGFITQQKLALDKFLPLYRRNYLKIHKRGTGATDYEHTLSTVWSVALSNLKDESAFLIRLLCFLDPDQIFEPILSSAATTLCESGGDNELAFLGDEMDFLDAKETLLRAALVGRNSETECLSVHRLIQLAVFEDLSQSERERYFNHVIDIFYEVFPSSWKKDTQDYVFKAWNTCKKCIQHIHTLTARFKEFKLVPKNKEKFIELLCRAVWYLYEAEHYSEGKLLLEIVLDNVEDKPSVEYATARNLLGLLLLDTGRPFEAIENFRTGLQLREKLLGPEHPRVATSYNNLGVAHTELSPSDLQTAMEFLEKALAHREKSDPGMIGNSFSNIASLLLRMGRPDEAEATLAKCPSLKDMSDESFLRTDNPRFSSDMFLLSRIRAEQGRLQDALRLGTKTLEFRKKIWGNGLKTCAALCHVATLLYRTDKSASSMLLDECINTGESLPEAGGYVALANFMLSQYSVGLKYVENYDKGKEHFRKALEYKKQVFSQPHNQHLTDFGDEDERSYQQLVPWMIW